MRAKAAESGELDQAVALLVEEEPSESEPQPQAAKRPHVERTRLVEDAEQMQQCTRRLQHLCELIARAREPYCPINGLLLLIPFGAAADELAASETAALAESDLETVHGTLQVRCPLVVAICDLEEAPGGKELLQRFPEEQRNRRLGASMPHLARCDCSAVADVIDTGVQWICRCLVQPIIYRLARTGCRVGTDADLAANVKLYGFLHELRSREPRIRRILTRSICPEGDSPWLVAGCYLAATGEDAVGGQGFAAGVFPQLVQTQNHVAWTRQALDDDRACRRWAVAGYVSLGVCAASVLALILLI